MAVIQVNIDAKVINKEITEAIARSAIGEQLKKTIEKKVEEFGKSWDNPLESIVDAEIITTVRTLIQEKYLDEISKFVAKQMTEEFVRDMVSKLWVKFIQRY